MPDARAAGRICALAFELQQELAPWVARHSGWIEGEYVPPVAHAYAFSAPWLGLDELLLCLKFELWVFGTDKLIDTEAVSWSQVVDLVRRWVHVAEGGRPRAGDDQGAELSRLRAQLTGSTLWPDLGPRWEAQFRKTYEGMLDEWRGGAQIMGGESGPTYAEYLDNSDSCGFRLIRLTDWIAAGEPASVPHLDRLMAASWEAQTASRLTNDLQSHEREHNQIDLNAIKLGQTREQVMARIDRATRSAAALLQPLLAVSFRPAMMLDRILKFGNAFYEAADFRPSAERPGLTA